MQLALHLKFHLSAHFTGVYTTGVSVGNCVHPQTYVNGFALTL